MSNPSFGGFSLLLFALAGVHKSVIFAGENSELNSFHLGQDCPQSFLNLTLDKHRQEFFCEHSARAYLLTEIKFERVSEIKFANSIIVLIINI